VAERRPGRGARGASPASQEAHAGAGRGPPGLLVTLGGRPGGKAARGEGCSERGPGAPRPGAAGRLAPPGSLAEGAQWDGGWPRGLQAVGGLWEGDLISHGQKVRRRGRVPRLARKGLLVLLGLKRASFTGWVLEVPPTHLQAGGRLGLAL
jgi:hypothetical protein